VHAVVVHALDVDVEVREDRQADPANVEREHHGDKEEEQIAKQDCRGVFKQRQEGSLHANQLLEWNVLDPIQVQATHVVVVVVIQLLLPLLLLWLLLFSFSN
jgi:hypothetical protein